MDVFLFLFSRVNHCPPRIFPCRPVSRGDPLERTLLMGSSLAPIDSLQSIQTERIDQLRSPFSRERTKETIQIKTTGRRTSTPEDTNTSRSLQVLSNYAIH